MAIQKAKTLPNGVSGDFWVIRGVYLSPDFSGVRAFADLFVDAGSAVTGVPIHKADISLAGVDNPVHLGELIGLIEQKLIATPGDFLSGVLV